MSHLTAGVATCAAGSCEKGCFRGANERNLSNCHLSLKCRKDSFQPDEFLLLCTCPWLLQSVEKTAFDSCLDCDCWVLSSPTGTYLWHVVQLDLRSVDNTHLRSKLCVAEKTLQPCVASLWRVFLITLHYWTRAECV